MILRLCILFQTSLLCYISSNLLSLFLQTPPFILTHYLTFIIVIYFDCELYFRSLPYVIYYCDYFFRPLHCDCASFCLSLSLLLLYYIILLLSLSLQTPPLWLCLWVRCLHGGRVCVITVVSHSISVLPSLLPWLAGRWPQTLLHLSM